MPRNMVIGKLKYLIGSASGMTCTLFVEVGFIFVRTYGAEWSDSVVGEGASDPQTDPRTGKKVEKSCGWRSSPYVCVRFPWPG